MEELFTSSASSKRLSGAGGIKQTYEDYIASMPCLIQPLEASVTQDREGAFGKQWLMMSAISDVIEGDMIIVDGIQYRVLGVEKHTFQGHSHMETTMKVM